MITHARPYLPVSVLPTHVSRTIPGQAGVTHWYLKAEPLETLGAEFFRSQTLPSSFCSLQSSQCASEVTTYGAIEIRLLLLFGFCLASLLLQS